MLLKEEMRLSDDVAGRGIRSCYIVVAILLKKVAFLDREIGQLWLEFHPMELQVRWKWSFFTVKPVLEGDPAKPKEAYDG